MTYDMRPLYLTCPACGKQHTRNSAWRSGDYCSEECYRSMPFPRYPHITEQELSRVVRQYPNQKAAAKALGVSYVRFRRVVGSRGLRQRFPAHGGAATWA